MNKDQFIALGISEEQATKAANASQEELKTYIPKHRFEEVSEENKTLKGTVKENEKQLEVLKTTAGTSEELKEQITKLQDDNKIASEKYEAEVKTLRINTALKLALASDTHDPDLVAGLLDRGKIELDDSGNVKSGLDEQIKSLRESKAFLFAEKKEETAPMFKGAKPPEGSAKTEAPTEGYAVGKSFAEQRNQKGSE
ncbi:phage scaffolding protein [Paenibacillus sp. IHBB 10380]|uniref:phage scaffolding protein n=1 Tax=Paenibacillus sp. IHBB 10380 TaxID=1566358 RepID=UPI0005CFCE0B|nr:phage scaffolding protein [Paenibacillus sp. IHBB 10380]AJS59861.1 hypothetical protein UB51_16780 [Paenibacillus sp. IHBB 10380]